MKKMFIIGDSTSSIKDENKRPETGWGEKISFFLNEDIVVINKSVNGRSTKSFINENRFNEIIPLFKKNDYLLIQFGHNDQKIEDVLRYTNPNTEYKENLSFFIDEAIKKGVIPVILSSITRRKYLNDKIDNNSVGDYPSKAKEIALEKNICFIDAFNESRILLDNLGIDLSKKIFMHLNKDDSKNYPEGKEDNTHFCDLGAKVIASMIANLLLKSSCSLKEYILKDKIYSYKKIKEELERKYLFE